VSFLDPAPFEAELAARIRTTLVVSPPTLFTKAECPRRRAPPHAGRAAVAHPPRRDLVIVLATGVVDAHLDRVRVAATDVVAASIQGAVRA
jgi:hypothetical protein